MGPRGRLGPLSLVLAVTLVACGSDGLVVESGVASATAVADTGTATALDGLELCDGEASLPTAPASWYRDRPRYVGNEQPTEAVRAWAESQPGFQQIWVDRDHNGWVTVGFSSDVDARQAEILERFPDDGVVAVLLDIDLAALRDLQQEVTDALDGKGIGASWGVSTAEGKVAVDVGLLTDENLAPLQQFAGRPVCVSGRDPAGTRTGPQAEAGEGWRLLAMHGSARDESLKLEPDQPPATPGGVMIERRLEIATSPAQLEAMWQAVGRAVDSGLQADTPMPSVDFDREIVVLGNEIESGSCRLLIFGLVEDAAERRLEVDRGTSDDSVVCTADANPLTWAIAVERSTLPEAPFEIVGSAPLWVDVDLRPASATVDDAATIGILPPGPTPVPGFAVDERPHAPPRPDATAVVEERRAAFPHVAEPGFPSSVTMPAHCVAAVGPINDYMWTPVSPALAAGDLPDQWSAAEPDGFVTVDVLLAEDPGGEPTLDLSANGHVERYLIAEMPPYC